MSRAGVFFRTTIMIVAVTMLSRMLGFIRSIFITNEFGVGMRSDAYFFAFNIPNTLFLVIPGAVNAVLIPTLKGYMEEGHLLERNKLFHQTMTWIGFGFLVFTAVGMLGAHQIIEWLAPSFTAEKQQLTGDLLLLMMPSVFFIGLISVLAAFLNAHEEFFAPSLGPVMSNLTVIASIFLLSPALGIERIAWGTTVGFAIFAGYLFLPTLKRRYSLRLNFKLRGERTLHGLGERFFPVFFGLTVSQVYLFFEKVLAGGLGDAKITALNLSFTMIQLPIAIFAGALAVPLFPLLSEYVKQQRMDDMKSVLAKGFLYQYHVLLPATVGLILLAEPFVLAFYEHGGEFLPEDAPVVAWPLIFYAIGMVGWAGRDLLTRASYAIENTKTPVAVGIASVAVSIALAYALMPVLDHGGLALAYALGTYFNMLLQAWLLRRQIGKLFTRGFYFSLLKGGIAGAGMAAIVWLCTLLWPGAQMGYVPLIVTIFLAAASYMVSLAVFREALLYEILDKLGIRRRMGGGL